jgi:predicted RNase H-like HicB family nuclease
MFKYSMQLFWSEEDEEYVALIPEFPHLNALAGTPEEAAREAQVVAGLYLEDMAECGEKPPAPLVLSSYSGELRVRMPRTLHQKLAGRALMENVSLNTLLVTLLAEGIGTREELPAIESKGRGPRRRITKPAAADTALAESRSVED